MSASGLLDVTQQTETCHEIRVRCTRAMLVKRPVLAAVVTDTVILVLAVASGVVLREIWPWFTDPSRVLETIAVTGPATVAIWLGSLTLFRAYGSTVFGVGSEEFRRVGRASIAAACAVGLGSYMAHFDYSRGLFVFVFLVGPPGLLIGRAVLRSFQHHAWSQGLERRQVVVVGDSQHVDEVVESMTRDGMSGFQVLGAILPEGRHRSSTAAGIPVLGSTESIVGIALEVDADTLVFTGGAVQSAADMREIAWALQHQDVSMVVAPSLGEITVDRLNIKPLGGLPLMFIDAPRGSKSLRWQKRIFDIVVAGLAVLALSPLFLVAALHIRRHDGGPVLFGHHRIGCDGKGFECWKFRTMVVDADSLSNRLQQEEGRDALLFKLKEDPRITPPGRWMRRFSVDELPQLFNVLRGDMSLIGPRPQVAAEVELYDSIMRRRLHVRPGMTGLWQVSGRSDLAAEEAIRLDLFYVDNWSMSQDLSILVRTVRAVFSGRGAY